MADLSQNSHATKSRIRTSKRLTRIDMTPMVDLAFLLLTFFILTTTFNDGNIIPLPMPDKDGLQNPVNDENVLNFVLAENNEIYWWDGIDGKVEITNYSTSGVRQVLLHHLDANPEVFVLIKPKDNSKYDNMVDILDEIAITSTKRYAIVDFTNEDGLKLVDK